jgi:hypothetical protein
MVCADPNVAFDLSLTLFDLNQLDNGRHVAALDQQGTKTLAIDLPYPPQHAYDLEFDASFDSPPIPYLGPPCISNDTNMFCEFHQVILGLTRNFASQQAPSPTPFSANMQAVIDGQPCTIGVSMSRLALGGVQSPVGIQFGASQTCRQSGSLTLYADRQESIPLLATSYGPVTSCPILEPGPCSSSGPPYHSEAIYPLAIPGEIFTLHLSAILSGSPDALPAGCQATYEGAFCAYDFNVKVAE